MNCAWQFEQSHLDLHRLLTPFQQATFVVRLPVCLRVAWSYGTLSLSVAV